MLRFVIFSIVVKYTSASSAGDLPQYFPRCHIDDPNLNKCLLKATEEVRPYIQTGIPELDIPSLDPLVITKISTQQGTSAVNYKVTLTNATIQGMGDYVFKELLYNPKTLAFDGTAMFKSLSLVSNYDINGKILLAPIQGRGLLRTTLGPSSGTLSVKGELVKRKGKEHYHPVEVKATIVISNSSTTFDGLFNGNEELSRATNQLINEHSSELLNEVTPAIEKVAEELVTKMMLGLNKNVPYNKLLPPSH